MDEFQGAITGIVDGQVVGWAWQPAAPQNKVSLELWLGPHLLGHCEASTFDPALAANGIGDGHHGFRFKPSSLPDIDFPATVFCRVVDSDYYLPGLMRIGSAQELTARLSGRTDTPPPAVGVQAPPVAALAQTPPPAAGAGVPPPAEKTVAVETLATQLTRLRDMIGQALSDRLEANLTILRDDIDREMQVMRRDIAALTARLDAKPSVADRQATADDAAIFDTDADEPPPPQSERPPDQPPAATAPEPIPAPKPVAPRPPPPSERAPVRKDPVMPPPKARRFPPLSGQRPLGAPLPRSGPRRPS